MIQDPNIQILCNKRNIFWRRVDSKRLKDQYIIIIMNLRVDCRRKKKKLKNKYSFKKSKEHFEISYRRETMLKL